MTYPTNHACILSARALGCRLMSCAALSRPSCAGRIKLGPPPPAMSQAGTINMLNRDPKTYSRWLTEDEIKIVADCAALHGENRAAEICNVATGTVRRAMLKHDVKPRKTGRPRQYTDEDRAAWVAFKGSSRAAAMHFGVGRNTILRERGNQRVA